MNIRTYTEQDTIFATSRLRLPREVNSSMEKWNKLAHTFHARVTFIPGMERPIGPLGNYTQTLTVTIEGDCDDPQCQKLFDALYSGDPQKIELIKKELRYGRATDDASNTTDASVQTAARNTQKNAAPLNRAIAVNSSDTAPLIKRVFMFLEDGEWDRVNEYCETVLDLDPENALAYLGMLMADLKVNRFKDLKDQAEPFDDNANYKKVVRFADEKLKTALLYYSKQITVRLENERCEEIYQKACAEMDSSLSEKSQRSAAELFDSILEYKDSDEKRRACLVRAEEQCKNSIYTHGISLMERNALPLYMQAIQQFEQIPGWKDADERIQVCRVKIDEIQKANVKKSKTIKIILLAGVILACLMIGNSILYNHVILYNQAYNLALKAIENGDYLGAYEVLTYLDEVKNGYKDSAELADSIHDEYVQQKFHKELSNTNVGEYISFGQYEQDNNLQNGKEDIRWIVLAKKDNRVLIVSKYALDVQPYHKWDMSVTWEKCSLRTWLNEDFFNTAFSKTEQSWIPSVTVDNAPNETLGNNTQDRVFLLKASECEEYNTYLNNENWMNCMPTEYAEVIIENYWIFPSDVSKGKSWWLRNSFDGIAFWANENSYDVYDMGCVRPALWIEIVE